MRYLLGLLISAGVVMAQSYLPTPNPGDPYKLGPNPNLISNGQCFGNNGGVLGGFACSGGGVGQPAYGPVAVTAQTSVTIAAATHGQGLHPFAWCENAGGTIVACSYTTDGSGNLTFTFSPAFTGSLFVNGSTGGFANPMTGADQYVGSNASGTGAASFAQLVACGDSTHTCAYSTSTHLWTNVAISGGSGTVTTSGSPAIHQVAIFSGATAITGVTVGTTDKPLVGVTAGDPVFSKITITNPATGATLTLADNKTLTISNTMTQTATDGSTIAFGAGGTVLYNGGALGTPSSATLTNATGLPIGGITGFGAGVGTWLATPSSANLASAVTDETGSGPLVFATGPTITSLSLGTTGLQTATCTAGTGGTTAGLAVKRDTSGNCITAATSDLTPIIGVAVSTAIATATTEVCMDGMICSCVADGTITAAHILVPGSSTAGRFADSGQTVISAVNSNVQVIGLALAAATVGNAFSCQFWGGGRVGANVGGQTGTAVYGAGGSGNTVFTLGRNTTGIHTTGLTGSVSIATLCSSAGGNNTCGGAGHYRVNYAFTQGGTACGTPGTGGVSVQLTWTDNAGAHSAITMPMDDLSTGTPTLGSKFLFTTSNTTATAGGFYEIWSTGAQPVQYATTYTACSVGTGTYEIALSTERLQ